MNSLSLHNAHIFLANASDTKTYFLLHDVIDKLPDCDYVLLLQLYKSIAAITRALQNCVLALGNRLYSLP